MKTYIYTITVLLLMLPFMLNAGPAGIQVSWFGAVYVADGGGYTSPSVAINNDDQVVLMYANQGSTMSFIVGKYNSDKLQVDWSGHLPAGLLYNGVTPSIAMNDNGYVITVFRKGTLKDGGKELYYNIGKLNDNGGIDWENTNPLDLKVHGHYPSVSINNDGQIIVAYERHSYLISLDQHETIIVKVGQLNPDNETVAWNTEEAYKTGEHPSVSLNNYSKLVMAYRGRASNNDKVYAVEGQVTGSSKTNSHLTVKWGSAHHLSYSDISDHKDIRNSITMNDNGNIIDEIGSSGNNKVRYKVGYYATQDKGKMKEIKWYDDYTQTNGNCATMVAIAMNNQGSTDNEKHFVSVFYNNNKKFDSLYQNEGNLKILN